MSAAIEKLMRMTVERVDTYAIRHMITLTEVYRVTEPETPDKPCIVGVKQGDEIHCGQHAPGECRSALRVRIWRELEHQAATVAALQEN
jgi:hypothetical protein